MDKIKSVFSAHKKSADATHDVQGQTARDPLAHHGPSAPSSARPGAGHVHEGMSEASIKSGVIGFGATEGQEHAVLSSHRNPDADLGSRHAPATLAANTSTQPGALDSPAPLAPTLSSDPFASTVRQESYTNDTDRSFPLAGGIAPKHDTLAKHSTEHTTTMQHPPTSEREPGTKDHDAALQDSHGREALAGAAAAATTIGAASLSQSRHQDVHDQGVGNQPGYGTQQPAPTSTHPISTTSAHNPDALAAATAAAAKSSTASPSTHGQALGTHDTAVTTYSQLPESGAAARAARAATSEPYESRYTDPGRPPGGRSLSYRHVPGGYPTPTPDESKTFLYYRDDVVPEPGADGPIKSGVPSTRGSPYGEHQLGRDAGASTSPDQLDPQVGSNVDGSRTIAGSSAVQHDLGRETLPGQHELRHTGSLENPESRTSENTDEHHYGRDAAIAGGLGAGAAGLGYAATHGRKTPETAGSTLPQETSPYSAKQLDPRALGTQARLEEQRFDPQARTESAHHSSSSAVPSREQDGSETSTSGPHKSSLLNKLDPRVKNETQTTDSIPLATRQKDPEHHYGRDAALVGGGAATAAGIHHERNRNNDPPATTTVSNDGTTHPASTTQYTPYQGPSTTTGDKFYGAVGAPAPVSHKSVTSDPSLHATADSAPTSRAQKPRSDTVLAPQSKDSSHHYGRDAGLAGAGLATAGGLAYAGQHDQTHTGPASDKLGSHSSNAANTLDPKLQPEQSQQTQQHHLGRDAAIAGGAGAAAVGAYEAINAYGDHRSTQPNASMNEQRYDTTAAGARAPNPVPVAGHYDYNNDHIARNAALGTGAALGAGGLYEADKQANAAHQAPGYPTQGTMAPQNTIDTTTAAHRPSHGLDQDPHDKTHTKRDAALLGTGAVAAGGAAYAYDQHVDQDQADRLKKEQRAHEKEQHAHEKEQHKLDKEHTKQEKEAHKLEKEREKEREKAAATPEKKHGMLGFLHRDKSKKEKRSSTDSSPRQSGEVRRSVDNSRHSREYAAGGAALGAGTAAAAYDDDHPDSPRWKGKNKLHKDPPKGHPTRDVLEHHEMGEMHGGKREHMGVDGSIGKPDAISGMHETRHNTYGAEPIGEALGQSDNKVIEPHTGLPMNVGRFGDGHGGTDANPTIHGHHEHGTLAGAGLGATGGQHATDWDAIKKSDTPY
ncbi:hypothetical protein ACEQ8H_006614 [Pleosporales sp. CAS-2024a]